MGKKTASPEPKKTPQAPARKPQAKVYDDYNKIREDFFPEDLKIKPLKFVAEKKDLELKVPPMSVPLKQGVAFKDHLGKTQLLTNLSIGAYSIKFENNAFIAKNKLEQKALNAQPKVVCVGAA